MPIQHANGIDINCSLQNPSLPSPTTETVVLINGLADDLESWYLQVPTLLTAGYRVVTFDNRGVGKSSSPPGSYTAELLADDTKALISTLGLGIRMEDGFGPTGEKFHLMGISMGGMIAQSYALAHPQDLLSLTLACTYASPGPFCSRLFSMWESAVRIQGIAGKKFVAMDTLLWCFTQRFFNEREEELKEVENALLAEGGQSLEAYLSQLNVIQKFDSRQKAQTLAGGGFKVLVLAGEEDILIPTRSSRELHGLIVGSEWRTVKGGHGCSWEFPEEFNEAFVEFLKSSRG